MLKVQVGKSGKFVGQSAVQLHGGMGMTDELNIGHYFKRLTIIDTMFGNVDHHLKRFAACSYFLVTKDTGEVKWLDGIEMRGPLYPTGSGKQWKLSQARAIEVDECDVAYRFYPSPGKPGMLLIHGMNAHSRWWDFIAPQLLDRFQIAAADLTGMGDSITAITITLRLTL